jgi:hypothetical protein
MKPDLCKEFKVRTVEGGFLVETPLAYFDNDRIVVFARQQLDGSFRLSDNGEAAERLTFDNVDPSSSRIAAWLSEISRMRRVEWDEDEQELWMCVEEPGLVKGIFAVAEVAAQLQAMTVMRSQRVDSTFKSEVLELLREAAEEAHVEVRFDIPILPGNHFTVDAYFATKKPLAVIVAGTRERLLEAELLWSTARRANDPTVVYAVVESFRSVGMREAERAGYFTDKVLSFRDFESQLKGKIAEQLNASSP